MFKLFIPKAVGKLKAFLEKKGTKVDIAACRAVHPGLMTFDDWIREQGFATFKFEKEGMCAIA